MDANFGLVVQIPTSLIKAEVGCEPPRWLRLSADRTGAAVAFVEGPARKLTPCCRFSAVSVMSCCLSAVPDGHG